MKMSMFLIIRNALNALHIWWLWEDVYNIWKFVWAAKESSNTHTNTRRRVNVAMMWNWMENILERMWTSELHATTAYSPNSYQFPWGISHRLQLIHFTIRRLWRWWASNKTTRVQQQPVFVIQSTAHLNNKQTMFFFFFFVFFICGNQQICESTYMQPEKMGVLCVFCV